MKNLPTRWERDWKRKPKDHKCRYCRWKNLPTWTKDREGKTEIDREEGHGRNKVLFSFGVELPIAKLPIVDSPTLHQVDRSPAICWLLALENKTNSDAFLVASLDAFCSTSFCWLFLLLFGEELDYWSSYQWSNVNGRRGCCRLVRMVLVEQADELSKVLDRWGLLPGILFLWIPFPRH